MKPFRDLMRSIDKQVDAQLDNLLNPKKTDAKPQLKPASPAPAQPGSPPQRTAPKPAVAGPTAKATNQPSPSAGTPRPSKPITSSDVYGSKYLSAPRIDNDVEIIDGDEEISIGLDWGTHSTKIVIRRGESELSELLIVEPAPDNFTKYPPQFLDSPYPYFAIPSVVGISAGTLRFGNAARPIAVTDRCYCLKASLFKAEPKLPEQLIEAIGEKTETDAIDVLAAAFLGWVLGRARESIDKLVGVGNWRPFVAICAPMARMENADLKQRYEMILNAAMLAAFSVEGPLCSSARPAKAVIDRLRRYLTVSLPEAGERRFVVAPETVSGLVPLQADPGYSPGLYSLVDIGGGSTELAIVHIVTTGSASIDCLADHSIPIGTIDLHAHKAVPGGPSPQDDLARTTSNMWAECYVSEFHRYGNAKGWKTTRVIKAGGGWRFEELEGLMRSRHASTKYADVGGEVADFEFVEYAPSTSIVTTAATMYAPMTERRELFRFLPVAIGLSRFPIWPKNWRPDDRPPSLTPAEAPPAPEATHGHS